MNLVKEILRDHSKAQCTKIRNYVGRNPERFAGLVSVFLAGPYRVTQRAAWPLSYCVEDHPELVKPHLRKLLSNLGKPGLHDAVKRNTVRLLQYIDVPKSLQGMAVEKCTRYLADPGEAIAVRVFSMTVLANIAQQQPDLKAEIRILIEDQLPYATAAFRARARKVLKAIS